MDLNELLERVRKTGASDTQAMESVARDVSAEVRAAPMALVDLWGEGQTGPAENAALAVLRLADLSLRPMMARWGAQRVDWGTQLMDSVVEGACDLRRRVWVQLSGLLKDTSGADAGAASQPTTAAATRVCDEAYLWIRRLAGNAEQALGEFHSEREFLALPLAERTQEIDRWTRSRLWADMRELQPDEP